MEVAAASSVQASGRRRASLASIEGMPANAVTRNAPKKTRLAVSPLPSMFGARLDADTRTIIEHGRRIRACLKQSEGAPVSVPAQIAVLLALAADLFDVVPLDRVTEAERAVQASANGIPAEVTANSRPPRS